ncbi:MAG: acyl-CoA dehydrogenase [Streptosporangiales bacterium]|nr:acyl-CoA dehydrogenase [Streptosporangiales bacterium]
MTDPCARLRYTADEDALRASVRTLLAERSPHDAVLARLEADEPYDVELWRALARQVGVGGLPIPESYGGAGAGWCESAVVAEELGACVAPTPFLGSAVLATAALLDLDGPAELLGALASGDRVATLAVPAGTMPDAAFPGSVRARTGPVLDGQMSSVVDVPTADVVLVPATGVDGPALYAVDAAAVGAERVVSLDLTRPLTDLTLTGAPARLLAAGGAAERAVSAATAAGAAVLASEQVGLAQRCVDATVEYAKQRMQFGRPVGSFQAVKHRLADVWVAVTQARAAARYAAACCAAGDPDTATAVALARSYCSETAVTAAEECLQLHGGIGFTWEHPAHLWLKRAKADALLLGAPHLHRTALASLIDLPG